MNNLLNLNRRSNPSLLVKHHRSSRFPKIIVFVPSFHFAVSKSVSGGLTACASPAARVCKMYLDSRRTTNAKRAPISAVGCKRGLGDLVVAQNGELSPKKRNDSAGSVHVQTVLLSKVVKHHLFLARNPIQVHGREKRQTGQTCDPIVQ